MKKSSFLGGPYYTSKVRIGKSAGKDPKKSSSLIIRSRDASHEKILCTLSLLTNSKNIKKQTMRMPIALTGIVCLLVAASARGQDPGFDYGDCNCEKIKTLLLANGFAYFSDAFHDSVYGLQAEENEPGSRNAPVLDFTDGALGLEGHLVQDISAHILPQGLGGFGYITDDRSLCDNPELFNSLMANLNDAMMHDLHIWWHVWNDPATGEEVLFYKIDKYETYLYLKFGQAGDQFDLSDDEPCKSTNRYVRVGFPPFSGTIEHWYIEMDYLVKFCSTHPYGFAEYFIPNSGQNGGPGYVDIANVLTGELFEIKPVSQPWQAETELQRYLTNALEFCPNTPKTLTWIKGALYPYTQTAPNDLPYPIPGKKLLAFKDAPGVILYYVTNGQSPRDPYWVTIPEGTRDRVMRWIPEIAPNLYQQTDHTYFFLDMLQKNPALVNTYRQALIGTGVALIVATIIEDIATAGYGVADDPVTIWAGYRLITLGL